MTNRRAPKRTNLRGNPLAIPCYLNMKPKLSEIFKLNGLHNIIIKIESYRAQTGLTRCATTAETLAISGPTTSNPPMLWCGGGHLHRECPGKTNTGSTPRCCNCTVVEENFSQRHIEAAAMRKENCKGEEHNELPRNPLGGRSSLSSPHRSSPTQLHCVKTVNTSNQWHRRQRGKRPATRTPVSATTGISENWSLSTGSQLV
jgi:hypothetical protein